MKTLITLFVLLFSLSTFACDVEGLRYILTQNLSSTLKCLGEDTVKLINHVQPDGSGETTVAAVEKYFQQTGSDPKILNTIKAISDLNHLVIGDEKGVLKAKSVDDTIGFLLVLNEEFALNISPIMESEQAATIALHRIHKNRVRASANNIGIGLMRISKPSGDLRKVNIVEVIANLMNDSIDLKNTLVLKKLFLGGSKSEMTSKELTNLSYSLPHLIESALEVNRYKYLILDQQSSVQILKMLTENVGGIIFGRGNRDSEVMITIDEVMAFLPEHEKLKGLVSGLKQIFAGGDSSVVTGAELKKILGHTEKMLMGARVSHMLFDKYRVPLESQLPIEINVQEATQYFPEYAEQVNAFARIVKQNRFMKGEFDAPYFTIGIRRNADAVAEIYVTEYILNEVMKKSSISEIVKKFEKELIELEYILPQSTAQFSDYVTLLGTVFTSQTNLSEFVTYLRSGSDAGATLFSDISKKCDASIDAFGRVEASCLKKEYMSLLCENNGAQFKLLCDGQEKSYLEAMTKVARTCNVYANKEEIPFSDSDVRYLTSSIMHVEAVMIKYDLNRNNVLDTVEAESAYAQLSPVLDAFIASAPALKSHKKKLYAYVLKFGKYPEVKTTAGMAKFIKFLVSFNTKPTATRLALANFIGQTLMFLESERAETNNNFNCEFMKDPQNIPYEM